MAESATKPTAQKSVNRDTVAQSEPHKPSNGPQAAPATGADHLAKARAARSPADPNESKADKFRRLANQRMPKLIRQLQAVAALANRQAYEFSDEQATKIIDTISGELKSIRDRFAGSKSQQSGWSL